MISKLWTSKLQIFCLSSCVWNILGFAVQNIPHIEPVHGPYLVVIGKLSENLLMTRPHQGLYLYDPLIFNLYYALLSLWPYMFLQILLFVITWSLLFLFGLLLCSEWKVLANKLIRWCATWGVIKASSSLMRKFLMKFRDKFLILQHFLVCVEIHLSHGICRFDIVIICILNTCHRIL